jgi:putative nucleotidyltransferase with HDIG domain
VRARLRAAAGPPPRRAGGRAARAAQILRWIGRTHRALGELEAALDCFCASEAVAAANGDHVNLAHALNWIGIAYQEWGALDTAAEYYGHARALAESAAEWRLVAMTDQNLGTISNIRGDLGRALEHYERSLARYRRVGDEALMANVLNDLGMLHTDRGEWPEAARAFREAARLSRRAGDLRVRAMVEINRVELHAAQGRWQLAERTCYRALHLASRSRSPQARGEALKWYGTLHARAGRLKRAETLLARSAEIAEVHGNPLLAAEVQRELARVYQAEDRNREALQALTHAHRLFTQLRASRDLLDVDRRLRDLESIFLEVVRRWGESIESADRYTAGHCERVADYGCRLARAAGLDEQSLTWFRMGAFLHDVGKVAIRPELLNKEGALTDPEWQEMMSHTVIGAGIVEELDFPWDIVPMVRSHHERWDGGGYPDGLQGPAIPLTARILCVVDIYDALTTDRPYRRAYSPRRALEIMEREAGTTLDPELFRLFRAQVLSDAAAPPREQESRVRMATV